MKHTPGLGLAGSLSFALLLAAPAVQAQQDLSFGARTASGSLLSLGLVASAFSHREDRFGAHTGFGGELAYQQLLFLTGGPSMFGACGLGAAAQLEGVDGFSHGRYAASARLPLGMLGTDIGIAREESDGTHRATSYVQLAPFFSAGLVWLSFRAAFPLGSGSVYGRELGVVLTLRLPLLSGH